MLDENMNYRLKDDLIRVNLDAKNREAVLRELGNMLTEKGYVNDGYTQALLDREIEFPTGILAAGGIGVAIPHTNAEYVNKTALAVGILKNSVSFEYMGCEDGTLDVDIVFVLAINNPSSHLAFLQSLMNILQKETVMRKLKNSSSIGEIKGILSKELI